MDKKELGKIGLKALKAIGIVGACGLGGEYLRQLGKEYSKDGVNLGKQACNYSFNLFKDLFGK